MAIITLIPLISGILVSILGFFAWISNRKSKAHILFFIFSFIIALWQIGSFKMLTSKTEEEVIFWDRINYISACLGPILMYHFALEFTGIYDKLRRRLLILGYILAFAFLAISRTDYFVSGVYRYSWGGHAIARIAHHPFLGYFVAYLFLFFFTLYDAFKKTKAPIRQRQLRYIFLAFFLFSAIGSPALLPAYGIGIYPFAYLSGTVFVILVTYTITRHFLFGIRILVTELLVGMTGIILLMLPFLMTTTSLKIFTAFTFFLFCAFGYFLIIATHQEVKRREEIEKLTEKLKKSYEELKKLDVAKTEFISIASHQLRTPLSAIKGYISMILENTYGELSEKLKRPLENIYASNERLIKLVNDILNVTRIETGKMEMNWQKLNLEEMIESVVNELKIKAKEKGIYLKFEKEREIPKIFGDGEKLRQVILNIVDNGIRYTKKGGVAIKVESENSKVKIIVRDTGEGMTKEELVKIFESFSRGAAGTKFYTEGVGLGLYIAKKLVEMHKGKIWAESAGPGKGSTFYIELPLK